MFVIRQYLTATCLLFGLLLSSCQSSDADKTSSKAGNQANAWTDSLRYDLIVRVARGDLSGLPDLLQDRRPGARLDALYGYTAEGVGLSPELTRALSDSQSDVRQRAIYCAGQQHDAGYQSYLMQAFDGRDSSAVAQETNRLILEAIGKCGDHQVMEQLTNISNYQATDSLLVLGQMRGLFQLMLRGYSDQAAQEKVIGLFIDPNQSSEVRTLAAVYLSRAPLNLRSSYEFELGNVLRTEADPALRILAAKIIQRIGHRKMVPVLKSAYKREDDPQVRYAIIDALSFGRSSDISGVLMTALKDKDDLVVQHAGTLLISKGNTEQSSDYWDASSDGDYGPAAHHYLAAATARHLPFYYAITRKEAIGQLLSAYDGASTPWTQIDMVHILRYLPSTAPELVKRYASADHPAVKTAIIDGLITAFEQAEQMKKHGNAVRTAIQSLASTIVDEGAPGPLAALQALLQATDPNGRLLTRKQVTSLISRLPTLKQPAELETYHLLVDLLQNYGIDTLSKPTPRTYASLDRGVLSKLRTTSRAVIKTSRGDIIMAFYDHIAPQSVSNFIRLAEEGFYDGKAFHRVVPNFVAQAGCPAGDGYGSLDYAIRSEFGDIHYDEPGAVGMASAGLHTESSQWFITLQPTPHLDGRYTLFAQVVEGMDVVKQLRRGDQITDVSILY